MGTNKEAQLRPCSIIFAEITGIENILDPEEYADALRDIFKGLDNAVTMYEGHIDKHEGKILMATFGVPFTHEDDPERAIRAALLMHKKVESYEPGKHSIKVKIGINMGRVFASTVGSDIKSEYTVMGDAVNIAARIMERANPDETLVSEEIQQITKPVFDFARPVEFQPQGAPQAIAVHPVLGMKSGFIKRRGIEGLQSPMVGRSSELKALVGLVEKLFENKGSVTLILGEAGVGKSRLIEELFTFSLGYSLEKARNINWCMGRCSPYKDASYYAFIEIIKEICDITVKDSDKTMIAKMLNTIDRLAKDKAEDIFPYIANLFNLKLEPKYETKIKHLDPKDIYLQTQLAIALLFKNYALQDPTVYCIDDLYLADMPTLDALKFVLQTAPDTPALFILVSRPEKSKPFYKAIEEIKSNTAVIEINLVRLSINEAEEISKNLLKIPRVSEKLINEVVSKSEGNPFYLEELIKLLISKGIIYRQGNEWLGTEPNTEVSIPYTIEGIIRARLDAMKPELYGILSEISVVGRDFSKNVLKSITMYWENFEELISLLAENGYIYTQNNEDFSFSHALVREVIYNTLSAKRLKELHNKVGDAIETLYGNRLPEFYELLFGHYSKTNKTDKIIDYGIKAGDNARKRYANNEAISYYNMVLKEIDKKGDPSGLRLEIIAHLGKIYSLTGQSDSALKIYARGLELTTDPGKKSTLLSMMANTYQRISDYESALEFYEKAEQELIGKAEEEKTEIRIGTAWVYYLKGEREKVKRILEKSIKSISDVAKPESRKMLAQIYNIMGSVESHIGNKKESFNHYNKSLKLFELLDDMPGQAVIYNNISGYFSDQGNHLKGLEYLQQSYDIACKTGNVLAQAISLFNMGETYHYLGDFEMAETYYDRYLKMSASINNTRALGVGNLGLGLLALERNEIARAEKHFTKALEIANVLKSRVLSMDALLSIATVMRRKGEFDAAGKLCDDVFDESTRTGEYRITIDVLLEKVKISVQQSQNDRKLMLCHLQEARKWVTQAEELIAKVDVAQDQLFRIYFRACEVAYYLGDPKSTTTYYGQARNVLNAMLGFVPDKGRNNFLQLKIYQEFEAFAKQIKM